MNAQSISPIQPLQAMASQMAGTTSVSSDDSSMFSQIMQSMVDNVKQTDAAKNETYYALATGEIDNPAQATIAATQASMATELLVQMRDRALDAYSELMRISL